MFHNILSAHNSLSTVGYSYRGQHSESSLGPEWRSTNGLRNVTENTISCGEQVNITMYEELSGLHRRTTESKIYLSLMTPC